MKILGISGSPRKKGTTASLVNEVLDASGLETEFISLAGKKINSCRFCLVCAKDNVCKVKDDMAEIRDKIVEADAYVIGGCNMWSSLNGLTHSFLERFFQFHHQGKSPISGKPGIVVGVGGGNGNAPATMIKNLFQNFGLAPIGSVAAQGAFACFSCKLGNTCEISLARPYLDDSGKIDMSLKPDLDKQPEVIDEARGLGVKLKNYLESYA